MSGRPTICPETRLRCPHVEVCWLAFCARSNLRERPISERQLTTAEKYALHMAEQRAAAERGAP